MRASVLLAALLWLLATPTAAQVSSSWLNVSCVWDPSTSSYEVTVHRAPGLVLVHTITDPAIVSAVCTADANDMMGWIQQDLQNNGTWQPTLLPSGLWGLGNDQLEQQTDVFCPDTTAVVWPSSIQSIAGVVMVSADGQPQAGAVVNYTCPGTAGGGVLGPPPTQATWPVTPCADGWLLGSFDVTDPQAAQLINLGDPQGQGQTGVNQWMVGTFDQAAPAVFVQQPVVVDHCDIDAASLAQTYLQQNSASIAPAPNAARCAPADRRVYVDTCEELGDDSAYGFDLYCCPAPAPPPPPPAGTVFGTNCYGLCMNAAPLPGVTVQQVTQMLGPAAPRFSDPATVCADLFAATRTWMDANLPGQPMCGPNWGGGNYVAGTLTMTNCGVLLNSPQCQGVPEVGLCLTYGCLRQGPLRPFTQGLLEVVSRG
jgi:hypothetical protein